MPRYALLMSYDGGDFAGWWRQPGRRTVASELDAACRRLGEPGEAEAAARTDAGVHATGQVAHLDCQRQWAPRELRKALDHQLPTDCTITAVSAVDDAFDASRDALGKTYRYDLDAGERRDPHRHRTCWRPSPLPNLQRLQTLAPLLVGQRDWRAFARSSDHRSDFTRTITTCQWSEAAPGRWRCELSGNGFFYRQVRSLVAAMVAVAAGSISEDSLQRALDGDDSHAGRQQAPAHGLCLQSVFYPTPIFTPT